MKYSPILTTDFYKTTHHEQYNPGLTKLVSYLTPRMSRTHEGTLVAFGIRAFIIDFLIDGFADGFFNVPKQEVLQRYERMMAFTMGENFVDATRWDELWELGYLPLMISAVPEGTRVPMGCPMVEITNTHPKFVWLVNFIETAMSCSLWHPMASANVGARYREIANYWYGKTVDDDVPVHTAISDFSMRGQESVDSAAASSAAFLLSFSKTATIPAIEWLEEFYGADIENELVATGLASTEHSVMCSNTAIDGDEKTFILKLLREIYPDDNFSMVSDSYDFWRLIEVTLREPEVMAAVEAHNGFIGFRGDSGDPVDILCGTCWGLGGANPEEKGLVETLWDIYGGTINSKGYKVLNPKVKAVYGDSITPQRAVDIYHRLKKKGFAANNVSLGMGSFSMQSVDGDPMTRDTYSIAVKSTYCELNGKPINIFKDPKTDTGKFKKSQKGCCVVEKIDGVITYTNGLDWNSIGHYAHSNLLQPIFIDSEMVDHTTFAQIRARLNKGGF